MFWQLITIYVLGLLFFEGRAWELMTIDRWSK